MLEGDPKFSAAEVNLLLHATESAGMVLRSIQDVLSVCSDRFSTFQSEGHYKNKILMLRATLSDREADELAVRIMSLLNSSDRQRLSSSLSEYSDEKGNLYLRLDKQRICQGRISLSENDAIRVRFRPVKRYRPSGNFESYRGLLSSTE
jgi:RNA binding exosome subunit